MARTEESPTPFVPSGINHVATATDWSLLEKGLINALEDIRQNPELMESFANGFAREINEPDTRRLCEAELGMLTTKVFRTKRNFEEVSRTLARFDAQMFQKRKQDGLADGDRIGALQPQWKKLQDKFNEVLKKSQTTAEKAFYQVKRYRQVILELANDPESKEDAIAELEGFIEDIERLHSNSDGFRADLDGLRSEISSFKAVMSMAMKDASANVDQGSKELKAKIEQVQDDLANSRTLATVGWGGGVFAAAAVGLGMMAMTPLGWVLAAIAAAAVVGGLVVGGKHEFQKYRLKNQLNDLRKSLADTSTQKKEIALLEVLFTRADWQINDICNCINNIAHIWSLFTLDANTLKSALQDAKNARTKAGLVRQIKMAQDVCVALEANLETYATKMAEVEAKVPTTKFA
ncbi:hypothetical protein DFH07DRAFT_945730 [Mycena maculata]|uniref:Uncharacterized protein n=1 Tax=Mycena maculata TaxID=230809 RepID=A0AAD7HUR3_9AGAR|nr:hypothetical protein DFH07DRAFT_945730 [Mycena maculata]